MKTTGKVTGIVSNLVTVLADGPVSQNEICYITVGDTKLVDIFSTSFNIRTLIYSSSRIVPPPR